MAQSTSRELLLRMLADDFPAGEELAAFVASTHREGEGQWFDYKSGRLLRDKADRRALVAALHNDASAFANADGGFLAVGYREASREFDGAEPPGGQPLTQWASTVLVPLAPIEHRSRVLEVAGKTVLLIAIARSRQLIPSADSDAPTFFLRFGDKSLPMPAWLVADLMLGRRAQPALVATLGRLALRTLAGDAGNPNIPIYNLSVGVRLANEALATTQDVRIGLVGWQPSPHPQPALPRAILRSIERIELEQRPGAQLHSWRLMHFPTVRCPTPGIWSGNRFSLGPMEFGNDTTAQWTLPIFISATTSRGLELRQEATRGGVQVKAALYVVAENCEPAWHQFTFRYDARISLAADLERHARIEPCARPVVSVGYLKDDEPDYFVDY